MRIKVAFVVVGISAVASANGISASTGDPSYLSATAQPTPLLRLGGDTSSPEILPLTNLASEVVSIGDGETEGAGQISLAIEKDLDVFKNESVEPEDSDPVFDVDQVLADSVTMTDSQFTVTFSDQIDFDPSTPAVDFDPVSITEADAKEYTVAELADNDLAGSPGLIGFTAYGDAQLSTAVKKYGTASLKLDGTGDYILSDDTITYGNDPFTVELWAYPTSGTQDDILFDSRASANDPNIMLRQSSDNLLVIRGGSILCNLNSVFAVNTWVHLAVTRGGTFGNTYTVFADGVSKFTIQSGVTAGAAEIRIGADFNNLNGWAGYVDGFALSTSDKHGGQGFTPAAPVAVDPTNPIVLTFDGANGSTTIDNTGIPETVDVYATESISNQPDIPKSDAVTATDTAPLLHPQPAKSETLTVTDAVDDFDIDKALDDSVTVSESTEKDVTHGGFSDSVTAVQSNLKTFNSSVDFDPSDDDVDPDPITVSEAISEFDFDKGLTDTPTVTETAAMDVTVAELADSDTASVTESIALDPESVLTDSLTAVEGIKLNPDIPLSDTATATESISLDARPPLSDTVTATESIDTLLTLGDSEYVYPDYAYIDDGYRRFIFKPYSYTISSTDYFVPNTGVIGAAETINSVMLADQFVTTPEDSGGLVVNFHYTDVDEDDRALGGYYFNQTPINAGNSTVGERTIL